MIILILQSLKHGQINGTEPKWNVVYLYSKSST